MGNSNSNGSGEHESEAAKPNPLVESGKKLRAGLVFMVASLAGYRALLFVIKIFLANALSVADYGMVTYCWSTGTTIGYLLMMGREHKAIVVIPRMEPAELNRTSSYITKTTLIIGITAFGSVLGAAFLFQLDIRIWGILAFALSNLVFQMEYYTLTSTRSFRSHFILTTMFSGGTLILIWVNNSLGIMNPEIALLSILSFLTIANVVGMELIRLAAGKRTEQSKNGSSECTRIREPWSFSEVDSTSLQYFMVDICATIVPLMPIIFLEWFATLEGVGYFGFGASVFRATIVLAMAVKIIYEPDLSVLFKTDNRKYVRYMDETISLTLFFQSIGVIGLAVLANWVVSFLGSGRYGAAVLILRILLMSQPFQGLTFACESILRTSENSRALLAANGMTLISALILMPMLVIQQNVVGAAIAYALILGIQGVAAFLMINLVSDVLHRRELTSHYVARTLAQTGIPALIIGIGLVAGIIESVTFLVFAMILYISASHLVGVTSLGSVKSFFERLFKR